MELKRAATDETVVSIVQAPADPLAAGNSTLAIVNGAVLPIEQARISLANPALLGAFGVYESIEVIGGVAFHLEDHLARLADSARMLDLELPCRMDELAGWVRHLMVANARADSFLRVVAWGDARNGDESVVAVLPQARPRYAEAFYRVGAPAVTFEGCRFMPACKSLNTLVNYLARRKAVRAGVLEGILYTDGQLTEGARSNLFVVRRGQLQTPPTDRTLSGITREVVLRLARAAGHRVAEVPIYLADWDEFEECFLTSTSMHIVPVVRIDGRAIGQGEVGPVTRDLMERFAQYHASYLADQQTRIG